MDHRRLDILGRHAARITAITLIIIHRGWKVWTLERFAKAGVLNDGHLKVPQRQIPDWPAVHPDEMEAQIGTTNTVLESLISEQPTSSASDDVRSHIPHDLVLTANRPCE
jgi:hypothetical protein